MSIHSFFRKLKIRLKTFIFITILTILEVVCLLWFNDWKFTFSAILPLFQLILIFEKKDIWNKLSDEEKEKILLSEDELLAFIEVVEKLSRKGDNADTILKKIKED